MKGTELYRKSCAKGPPPDCGAGRKRWCWGNNEVLLQQQRGSSLATVVGQRTWQNCQLWQRPYVLEMKHCRPEPLVGILAPKEHPLEKVIDHSTA